MRWSELAAAASVAASTALASPTYHPLHVEQIKVTPELETRAAAQCLGTPAAPFVGPVGLYPIQQSQPNKNFGNTFPYATVTPGDICTIFDIYLPPDAFLKACTLSFYLPAASQLAPNSSLTYSTVPNGGHFTFAGYTGRGTSSNVTYATQPQPDPEFLSPPPAVLKPGNAYKLFGGFPGSCLGNLDTSTFPPKPAPFRVGGRLCSNDTTLIYTQNTAACALGLFVSYS